MKINPKDILLVSFQFVLFGCYTIDFDWSLGFSLFFKLIGLSFAIIGLVISLLAVLQLNKNLSPFPTPKKNAVLLENGLYKFVRHPIYSGLLLLFYGYGIYVDSIYKLLISSLLLVLFYFKTYYEERLLEKKFSVYSKYKQKVNRFFPKIYK
jgi:protein-S-isoprenylcysteine O-methyltransferase Ste14